MNVTEKKSPVEYISPSAYKMWKRDPEGYYKHYVLKIRDASFPYAREMALGSAFDALVKAELGAIYGVAVPDLLSKIASDLRDEAITNAKVLFQNYKDCGAFADLTLELDKGFDLKMEFAIQGTAVAVPGNATVSVPIMGIPDYSYRSKETGDSIVSDWKVRSGYANRRISPSKGYSKFREFGVVDPLGRPIWTRHKDFFEGTLCGIQINTACLFESCNEDWAIAAVFYYALLGENAYGTKLLIGAVEEITPTGAASLRMPISEAFQASLWASVADLWERVTSGHYFRELPLEESIRKCEMIERVATMPPSEVSGAIDSWQKGKWR